jgi:large subunit ribosomal protein L21
MRLLTSIFRNGLVSVRSANIGIASIRRNFSSSLIVPLNVKAVKPQDPIKLLKRNIEYLEPKDITPLKEAHSLYATIHVHDRKFLVSEGDKIILPIRLKDLEIGDVLNFDQVSVIGSRDYTLTGSPRITPNVFRIKGRVTEITRAKREVGEKTKRRRRHVRHIVKKNFKTVIRISELKVNPDYQGQIE